MEKNSDVQTNIKNDVALAKKIAKEKFSDAKKKLLKAEKDVQGYIEKNPKKAIAIAAGVGAAIGAIAAVMVKHKK